MNEVGRIGWEVEEENYEKKSPPQKSQKIEKSFKYPKNGGLGIPPETAEKLFSSPADSRKT